MLIRPQEWIPVPSQPNAPAPQTNSEGASSVLWVTESPAVPASRSPSLRTLSPGLEVMSCHSWPGAPSVACGHGLH